MGGSLSRSSSAGDKVLLSTGHTIELPAVLNATMTAAIVPADRDLAADLLPAGLSPLRAGRGTAAVWLLSTEYHDINNGALEPYNEFAVVIAATPDSSAGIPYLSPLLRTEGYVWFMPVTTESSRAFGQEIWGYPKVTAEIDIVETDGRRRTTVHVNDKHFMTVEVQCPRTVSWTDQITTYPVQAGSLHCVSADLSGEMGIWPYSSRFSYTLGDHPSAKQLQQLLVGDRAFARFHAAGQLMFPVGKPLEKTH